MFKDLYQYIEAHLSKWKFNDKADWEVRESGGAIVYLKKVAEYANSFPTLSVCFSLRYKLSYVELGYGLFINDNVSGKYIIVHDGVTSESQALIDKYDLRNDSTKISKLINSLVPVVLIKSGNPDYLVLKLTDEKVTKTRYLELFEVLDSIGYKLSPVKSTFNSKELFYHFAKPGVKVMARNVDKEVGKIYSFKEAVEVCKWFDDTREDFEKLKEEMLHSILMEVRARDKSNKEE